MQELIADLDWKPYLVIILAGLLLGITFELFFKDDQ